MRTIQLKGLVREKRQNLFASKLCEPSQISSALAEIGRQLQILVGAQIPRTSPEDKPANRRKNGSKDEGIKPS